jgi:cell division protein FtsW
LWQRLFAVTPDDGQVTRAHRPDYVLLLIILALLAIGTVVVYSIGPAMAAEKGETGSAVIVRQLAAIGVGLLVFVISSRVPFRVWKHAAPWLLMAAAALTLITFLTPLNDDYQAYRWIRIGDFSFQSVEAVKFALLVWGAGFFARQASLGKLNDWHDSLKYVVAIVGVTAVVVAILQRDLGSTAVLMAMLAIMLFASGLSWRNLGIAAVIIVAAFGVFIMAGGSYRMERLTTFTNQSQDCNDDGYQACQALIAVGSGGMIGLGLGNSVQAYGYLPEAEDDSIFAIYAEKFGFVGVAVLLGLLVALYTRLKRIADRAPDNFSRLFVLGVFVWLAVQAFMNVGAMLGILPLKGITLPLISAGGSSVLVIMAVLGIVFQISRYTNMSRQSSVERGSSHDDSGDRRRVRGARYATYSGRR